MFILDYADFVQVLKSDADFRKKNLNILTVETLEENYKDYNDDLEKFLWYEACRFGRLQLVSHFIHSRNVSQEMLNRGLLRSLAGNEFETALYLIKAGADPYYDDCEAGRQAVKADNIKFLKKLKKCGFDLKCRDEFLLDLAVIEDKLDVVKFLVKEGLRKKSTLDKALRIALKEEDDCMIDFLIKHGADPNNMKLEYIKYLYS